MLLAFYICLLSVLQTPVNFFFVPIAIAPLRCCWLLLLLVNMIVSSQEPWKQSVRIHLRILLNFVLYCRHLWNAVWRKSKKWKKYFFHVQSFNIVEDLNAVAVVSQFPEITIFPMYQSTPLVIARDICLEIKGINTMPMIWLHLPWSPYSLKISMFPIYQSTLSIIPTIIFWYYVFAVSLPTNDV